MDNPPRANKAILAALIASEGRPTHIERLRKALPKLELPLEQSMSKQWDAALKDLPDLPEPDLHGPGEIGDQVRKQLLLRKKKRPRRRSG